MKEIRVFEPNEKSSNIDCLIDSEELSSFLDRNGYSDKDVSRGMVFDSESNMVKSLEIHRTYAKNQVIDDSGLLDETITRDGCVIDLFYSKKLLDNLWFYYRKSDREITFTSKSIEDIYNTINNVYGSIDRFVHEQRIKPDKVVLAEKEDDGVIIVACENGNFIDIQKVPTDNYSYNRFKDYIAKKIDNKTSKRLKLSNKNNGKEVN
jgi:hypothetical protein